MENNQLITIKQLPVIEEQLKTIGEAIDEKIEYALALTVTEDTVKEVKKVRAELNVSFKALEDQRKTVKQAIAKPYEDFEKIYRQYVTDKFAAAGGTLKKRIDEVEGGLKESKEEELNEYFDEYALSYGLDFLLLDDAKINVTLSESLKAMKEAAKKFIDNVRLDIEMIGKLDHADEVLVEYKKTFSTTAAINTVTDRHRAQEEEKRLREERELKREEQAKTTEKVEQIMMETAPAEISVQEPEAEEEYTLEFSVTATKPMLIALKQFLNDGGYKYE